MKYILLLIFPLLMISCSGTGQKETSKKDTINSHLPTEPFPTDNQYKDSIKRPVPDSTQIADSPKKEY